MNRGCRDRGRALVAVGDDHVVVGGQRGDVGWGHVDVAAPQVDVRERRHPAQQAGQQHPGPDGNSAIRTSPPGRLRSPSTAACARASAVNTSSACVTSACPAAVSRSPRPAGSVSGTPTSAVSARSCWEIADGVNDSAAATAVTDPAVRQLAEHPQPRHVHEATLQRHVKIYSLVFPVRRRHGGGMPPRDRLLAALVAVLWGANFLAIHVGLQHFPPLFLAALRFAVIALPTVLLVPRPQVRLRWLLGYGLGFGTLQFLFLFVAMDVGHAHRARVAGAAGVGAVHGGPRRGPAARAAHRRARASGSGWPCSGSPRSPSPARRPRRCCRCC